MQKYFFFLVSIFLVVCFIKPQIVSAHFPATDNNITTILHIDPNDDPIPTKQAYIYFDIEDISKRFSLTQCDCLVTVSEQGKTIYQNQLSQTPQNHPSIWGARVPFVFPKRDVYHIALDGAPVSKGAFQSFHLSWDFRVDEYPPIPPSQNNAATVKIFEYVFSGFILMLLLFFAIAFFVDRKNKQTYHKQTS